MRAESSGRRGRQRRERRDWGLGDRQSEKKNAQPTQPSGPESLPHLQNQKHLLIASKRQRGSVSLSAAVIPHSDEHLKCQDPFQQLCTSNQALSSVTTILQPLPRGPHDFSPHCVWRQGMWEDTNKHHLWEGRPGCWGPGRRERPELGGEGEATSCLACLLREVGEKVITCMFGGLGLDREGELSTLGFPRSRGWEQSAVMGRRFHL